MSSYYQLSISCFEEIMSSNQNAYLEKSINFCASNLTQPVRVCFKSLNYYNIGFQSSNSLQYKKKCCGTIFIPRLTKILEHLFKLCMKKLLNCKIQTSKASIKNKILISMDVKTTLTESNSSH